MVAALMGTACQRKIAPAEGVDITSLKYNEATYNYFYAEAVKQKLLGNIGDALKYFEQCVKINPESDASYYQMAQIVMSNGDTKNAKDFLKKAIQLESENVWYLKMMAGIYYQEKNLDSAIIYYKEAVRLYPDRENLQLTLGNLYSEDQKYDEANRIFDAFDKKYGINEESTVSSVRSLMAEEKYDEALEKAKLLVKLEPENIVYNGILAEVYRSIGDNKSAREVYDKLLEKNPDNPQVQLALCSFLMATGNYSDLFLYLDNALLNNQVNKQDKISIVVQMIDDPVIYKEYGDKLMNSIIVLEANYKEDYITPLLRPELLIKENKLDEAAGRLEEIVKELPGDYYAWEKLLLVYLQEGDYKNLTVKGKECATMFNRSFLAKVLYANGAMETGEYNTALDELKKAEILAGNNKDSIVQVLTMRADVYYRMKNYSKTFEVFDEALRYNNDDLTVLNNYAYYLAEQDTKLKEAEEMSKKVIDEAGDNNTFLDTYAWILYKRGKLIDAENIMEKILRSGGSDNAEYFEHYGYILKKLDKCEKAIESWKTALKIDSTKVKLEKEIENCKK